MSFYFKYNAYVYLVTLVNHFPMKSIVQATQTQSQRPKLKSLYNMPYFDKLVIEIFNHPLSFSNTL